ncbi:MAG: iron ABC transporter permease [Gemmatimonadales bacterium]|nr:iron ABC transporter permease [Gemmatimonadales bacterium]
MKFLLLCLATVAAVLVALAIGAVPLPLSQVVDGVFNPDGPAGTIVWQLRMPRILLAFAVGGALGVSGAALQALVRNPLAEPYLLGISGGAGLGAVAAIALGFAGLFAVPTAAFLGALAASAAVYGVAVVQGTRLEPRVLVLVGVVIAALCGALTSALLALSEAAQLRNAFLWLLGGFAAASWPAVGAFTVYALLPLVYLFGASRSLDLLSLGDEPAHALGLRTELTKRTVFLATALLTAASVAVSGMIGFVGLLAPHAMRGWVGPRHGALLPAVFVASGGLLILADAVARTVLRPAELPIGAITALIGVPLFAALVRRSLT